MNNLNYFLNEALKINSKSKISINNILSKILGFDKDDDKDIIDVIDKWYNENNISNFLLITDEDTMNDMIDNGMPRSYIKYFNFDQKNIDKCSKEINDIGKSLFEDNKFGFIITGSNNVLKIDWDMAYVIYVLKQ